jgi:hypothetical protein
MLDDVVDQEGDIASWTASRGQWGRSHPGVTTYLTGQEGTSATNYKSGCF